MHQQRSIVIPIWTHTLYCGAEQAHLTGRTCDTCVIMHTAEQNLINSLLWGLTQLFTPPQLLNNSTAFLVILATVYKMDEEPPESALKVASFVRIKYTLNLVTLPLLQVKHAFVGCKRIFY